jgi:16S rRNA (guanine527-N7)-methyltransferase
MTIDELGQVAAANELALSNEQLGKLSMYAELLRAKNQVVNLISRKDEENILSKHILHSLTLLFPNVSLAGIPQGAKVFDLGTGGGLPGIPIKIARPDISLLLCDSILKKIVATSEMVTGLGLKDVQAITIRAEVLAAQDRHRRKYDVVVTRAVAQLDEIVQWSCDLLKKGGLILSLKGGSLGEEIKKAKLLKFVKSIDEQSLGLEGYDEFMKEEKKIVRVTML